MMLRFATFEGKSPVSWSEKLDAALHLRTGSYEVTSLMSFHLDSCLTS